MRALPPSRVGCRDTPRCLASDGDDLESKPVDQLQHFFADVPARCDDQGFGNGGCGDHEVVLGRQRRDASVGLGLAEHDRHQSGGVDRDHSGKPSSR
jgi:hypothetical protein